MQLNRPQQASIEITNAISKRYGPDSLCFKIGKLENSSLNLQAPGYVERDLSGGPPISSVKPLDSIKVFYSDKGFPHWHYVTCGFSDLYSDGKNKINSEISGYGFELSIRYKKPTANIPPTGPIYLLQELADYVFSMRHIFHDNEIIPYRKKIVDVSDATIETYGLTCDKEFSTIETASGKVKILQLVGLTLGEYELIYKSNLAKKSETERQESKVTNINQNTPQNKMYSNSFLEELATNNPYLIIDPKREPKQENAATIGAINVELLNIYKESDRIRLVLDTSVHEAVSEAMARRLPAGFDFHIYGPNRSLVIFRAAKNSQACITEGGFLLIDLSSKDAKDFTDIFKTAGELTFNALPNLILEIQAAPEKKLP